MDNYNKPKEHFEIYNALNEYVEQKASPISIRTYRLEYKFFNASIVCFLLAMVLAISSNFLGEGYIKLITLFTWRLVGISQILMMFSQLIFIFSALPHIINPIKGLLKPIMHRNSSDFHFAQSLTRHKISILKSVQKTFDYEIEAMYARVGILVGAVDKMGIIFAAFTIFVAYSKLKEKPLVFIQGYEYIIYTFIILYFIGLYFLYPIYRLKKYSLIMNMAIDIKDENNK